MSPTANKSDDDHAKSSFTALSIGMSFARSIESQKEIRSAFSTAEAAVTRFLISRGLQSLTWFNWALAQIIGSLPYTWQRSIYHKYVIPGHDERVALRKHMIKSKILSAIEEKNVAQIVFLGGGYDVRALFTALHHPNVNIFEVDRGATREHKIIGIKNLPKWLKPDNYIVNDFKDGSVLLNDNLCYIDSDLTQNNLYPKLKAHGYDASKKTIIISEGVTAYLSKNQNIRLLDNLHSMMSEDSELLMSFMSSFSYSTVSEQAYSSSDEILQFMLPPKQALAFFAARGLDIREHFSSAFHLRKLGANDAADQFEETGIHEHYYLMKRFAETSPPPYRTIDDVPSIPPTLLA